jgi:hypothetical protein
MGVQHEVVVQRLGDDGVVGAAGDLDVRAALEAHAVAGVDVAEVAAALVLAAGGVLLARPERVGLVRELGDAHRGASPGVDVEGVEGGPELVGEVAGVVGVSDGTT